MTPNINTFKTPLDIYDGLLRKQMKPFTVFAEMFDQKLANFVILYAARKKQLLLA